jgi:hypothetical protein
MSIGHESSGYADGRYCNAGFVTMGSGYGPNGSLDGHHSCILLRLHEGAHVDMQGFTWGLVNGHDDPWHQRLIEHDRKVAEKRAKSNRRWYRRLANRGFVKPSQRASG